MKKECILTGITFSTDDREKQISPVAMENIVREINHNKQFKEEVVSAIMQDEQCLRLITTAVLSCKMEDLGISVPGTVAEFFCEMREEMGKQETT